MIEFYASNEDALLKVMVALEFGVLEREERRNPFVAGVTSGLLFLVASLPSLLPYALCSSHTGSKAGSKAGSEDTNNEDVTMGTMLFATFNTPVVLLIVGLVKSTVTRMNWLYSSIETFVIVGLGGSLAFLIGSCLK